MEDSEVSPDSTADTAGVGPTPARGMALPAVLSGSGAGSEISGRVLGFQGRVLRFQGSLLRFHGGF